MNRSLRPVLPRHDLGHDPVHDPLPWPRMRAQLGLSSRTRAAALTLMALTCAGFALRVALIDTFPLREDEAIYGFWARAAATDPFWLQVWPDKPPLFIWLLQGVFALLGPSAAAARLVSIFASTLTIPLVAWGALGLWRSRMAALLAAMLFAFSPYAVSFASTAYTDSLLSLLGLGAVVCALRGRGLAAGLLLAAACMTKQQGLLYAPLVLGLLLYEPLGQVLTGLFSKFSRHDPRIVPCHRVGVSLESVAEAERPLRGDRVVGWPQFLWALLGAALIVLPILWWDSQRWAVAPSPWALAQQTYAPLTWLPLHQWWPRAVAWAEWLWYLGGSWTVWSILGAALAVALVLAAWRVRLALLVGWGVAFLALHIVTSMQVWDRYLLPLAGWLALVASGPGAMVLSRRLPNWVRGALLVLLLIGMTETIVPGVNAAQGRLPIGGDHGDYAGLTEAMAWVAGQCVDSPCPAILYHQVLGWHFRFYLYDELQPQGDDPSRFDLRWFPSAAYLADNAAKTPYPPKYLIMPEWATPRDLDLHLALRGLALEPRLQVGRFAVMEIVQPPRPLCEWCKSPAQPGLPFVPTLPPMSESQLSEPQMSERPTP